MDTYHTISQVAARTGFTSSALRYYENAGLITPERSAAGYRIYDDRSIERLRFISRAKQLGLSLDEITDLVQLWDGEQCVPVAERLRELIDEKIGETQNRVAELVAFIGDLQRFRSELATFEAPAGPCGDDCACQTSAGAPGPVPLIRKVEAASDTAPIACSLEPSEMTNRMNEWQQLLEESDRSPTAVDGGVAVRFRADRVLAGRVAELAAAEQACCNFFAFTVRIEHAGTTLTVTAPLEATPLVDALFGVPA